MDAKTPAEPVARLLRYAGQTLNSVRNPNLTAREAIVIGDWMQQQAADLEALRAESDALRTAIVWALGAGEEFPQRGEGDGPYWWRPELRRRAGLEWSGCEYVAARAGGGNG